MIIIVNNEKYIKLDDLIDNNIDKQLISFLDKTIYLIVDKDINVKDEYTENDIILIKYNWCLNNIKRFKKSFTKYLIKDIKESNLINLIKFYNKYNCDIQEIKEYYKPKEGFIYIMHNKLYGENIYKIGNAINIEKRLKGYLTGYIEEPEILLQVKCIDKHFSEKYIFRKLKDYRIRTNREFFEVDINIIKNVFNEFEETINKLHTANELIDYVIDNKLYDIDDKNKNDENENNNMYVEIMHKYMDKQLKTKKTNNINTICKVISKSETYKTMPKTFKKLYNNTYIKNYIKDKIQNKIIYDEENKQKSYDKSLLLWFKQNYIQTGLKSDYIQIKDIRDKFYKSSIYKNFTKEYKLIYNKSYIVKYFINCELTSESYKSRTSNYRNAIIGWKII